MMSSECIKYYFDEMTNLQKSHESNLCVKDKSTDLFRHRGIESTQIKFKKNDNNIF